MTNKDVLAELNKVELTEDELTNVVGGFHEAASEFFSLPSAGWVCTISGECNFNGHGCNPF